ncbi:chemotaxis protein CheW [Novipirellula artificiosorum]|uniref:CheW-like domain protein n=1 Tax=Novipirellula artificiosorum TaxID=2528016 RepID=A0A5C6D0Z7_9BACT|nr:chemotaxis protein CheW [Novipirellula artificiosorum]TWU30823.1 CheW-like domain protein [Novipirellula artificiosorum]
MNTPIQSTDEDVKLQVDTDDEAAIQRLLDKPLSLDDLRERTRRVAMPLEMGDQDVVRLLVFQVGEELMAVKAVEVHQVTQATPVHRIPHRSNHIIRGLCNLDGDLMLCADLEKLLDLREGTRDRTKEKQRWMIVLGDEPNHWVVEIDSVRGVIAFTQDTFRRPPITVDAALARYTKSLVPLDQETVALLDLQRVVSGFQAALR